MLQGLRARASSYSRGDSSTVESHMMPVPQTSFFRAATGKALTIVRAGLAFTIVILPKTSRLPALVAGFTRVLIRQRPGMLKTPAFLISLVAISARLSRTPTTVFFLSSQAVAMASARPPLDMALAVAFFIALGAMTRDMKAAGQGSSGDKTAAAGAK